MKSDFPIDNKPKLRNCPFCGNEAYLIGLFVPYDDDEINEYQVGCEECGIHFNQSWEYDTIVDLWNGEYYKNEQETEKEIYSEEYGEIKEDTSM